MTTPEILAFYRRTGAMTEPAGQRDSFQGLPRDVGGLARVLHGLILHEHIAPSYGVTLADERRREVHIRTVEQRLQCLRARDARPLTVERAPEERIIGNCRHFTVLMVAMLRAQGVAARARCGFGAYFEPGRFVDHWVCEYWNAAEERWVMVDAQIDEVQRGLFHPDFDLLDVPRERFLVAGAAWARCRAGDADPAAFGILDMHGLWFVAGNLVRDAAALNNMEMLPWDVWGAMPRLWWSPVRSARSRSRWSGVRHRTAPADAMAGEMLAFFDRLAALTIDPDASFAELRGLYTADQRLRVPATVFNAVLNRPEML